MRIQNFNWELFDFYLYLGGFKDLLLFQVRIRKIGIIFRQKFKTFLGWPKKLQLN